MERKRGRIRRVKYCQAALAIAAALSASLALADDFKTINGKEYKNATVSHVEPDGIVLKTKSGISKIYFTELPKDVQERFHYDPEKAAAAEKEQQNAVAQQRKADDQAEQVAQGFETRLGETFDQCVQRYGPLIRQQGNPDNPQFIFEKDEITIGINFLDGKAAHGRGLGGEAPQVLGQALTGARVFAASGAARAASSTRSRTSARSPWISAPAART